MPKVLGISLGGVAVALKKRNDLTGSQNGPNSAICVLRTRRALSWHLNARGLIGLPLSDIDLQPNVAIPLKGRRVLQRERACAPRGKNEVNIMRKKKMTTNTKGFSSPVFAIIYREKIYAYICAESEQKALERAASIQHELEFPMPRVGVEARFVEEGPITDAAWFGEGYFLWKEELLRDLGNNSCPVCGR